MSLGNRIGLAVITYNRPEYLERVLERLEAMNWGGADIRLIVEDYSGNKGYDEVYKRFFDKDHKIKVESIKLPVNATVGPTKNVALKYLMSKECRHLFLMEDDILLKKIDVCDTYAYYAKTHGFGHLNFALHGPMNKNSRFMQYSWKKKQVCVYPHIVGAFSYYSRESIKKVGYFDEAFKNAWEHVEHTYRMAKAEFTTPFWFFADHPNSQCFLEEIPESIENSSIPVGPGRIKAQQDGIEHWRKKYGSWIFDVPEGIKGFRNE